MSTSSHHAEKAQRSQQACKRCRSRKSRCDAGKPSCSACLNHGHECLYDSAPRRRGPGRSKEYVRALEERLSRMESTLQHAGLSQPAPTAVSQSEAEDASPTPDADVGSSAGDPGAQDAAAEDEAPAQPIAAEASQQTELMFPNYTAEAEIEAEINARLPVFGAIIRFMQTPQPKLSGPTFARTCYTAGLNRHDALTLWLPLSEDLSITLPTVNLACLLQRFAGHQEADDVFNSAAGWAYANGCIGLGANLKCVNQSFAESNRAIWSFFMNAFGTLPELMAKGDSALAVQAVVGMALYMQGTISTSTVVMLASSAAALSNRLGLHRGAALEDEVDSWVRDRVFWSVYILDKSTSLHHGVPSMLPDDEIEVGLPDAEGMEVFWFQVRAQLATIESQVFTRLFTAKRLRCGSAEIFQSILDCDVLLDEWKTALPWDLGDDIDDGCADEDELTGEKLDVFLAFNSCRMQAHWAKRRHNGNDPMALSVESSQPLEEPAYHFNLPSSRHCLLRSRSSAQAVIRAFCSFPSPPYTSLWRTLCYPLCAVLVLLTDILDEPGTGQAIKLLQSTRSFARFLQKFEREERCDLNRVLRACAMMQRTAQGAVQEAHEGARVESPQVTTPGTPRPTSREDAAMLLSILSSATSPMYLVQGLLGNQPNRDAALSTKLAELLGCSGHESKTGIPLGPEALWPPTYGVSLTPGT